MYSQEKVWNKIAEKWNEYRVDVLVEVVDFLKGKKGKVLDLGCGSGRNFIDDKKLKFYGIDFAQNLLDFAKEKNYVELKKAEVSEIPYEDRFFDYVIYVATLHCVPEKEKRAQSLKELYRVLKKNGKALISVWSKNQFRVRNKPKECFVPWAHKGKKYERYYYIYDKAELEADLEDIGFKIKKSWEDENINVVVEK